MNCSFLTSLLRVHWTLAFVVLLIAGCSTASNAERDPISITSGSESMRDYAVARMVKIVTASDVQDFDGIEYRVHLGLFASSERFDAIRSMRARRTNIADVESLITDFAAILYGMHGFGVNTLTPEGSALLVELLGELLGQEAKVMAILNEEAQSFDEPSTHEALFIAAALANRYGLSGSDELLALALRAFSRELPAASHERIRSLTKTYRMLLALEQGDWQKVHRVAEEVSPSMLGNQEHFVQMHSGMIINRMDVAIWLRNWLDDPGARLLLDAHTAIAFGEKSDAEAILRSVVASSMIQSVDEAVICGTLGSIMSISVEGGYWPLFDDLVTLMKARCDSSIPPLVPRFLARKGEVQRLENILSSVRETRSKEDVQILRAHVLAYAGRSEEAIARLDELDVAGMSEYGRLLQIAEIYARAGDIESAISIAQSATRLEDRPHVPSDPWMIEALELSIVFAAYHESGATAEAIHRRIEGLGFRPRAEMLIWASAIFELHRMSGVSLSIG